MKKTLALVGALSTVFAVANAANASAACSDATLKGTYVYAETIETDGKAQAIAGMEYFDGAGNIVGVENDSSDKITGKTAAEAKLTDHAGDGDTTKYKGTYKIEADCRGLAIYDDGTSTRIFVKPDGEDFHFISLDDEGDDDSVMSGEDHRYSTENLLGN